MISAHVIRLPNSPASVLGAEHCRATSIAVGNKFPIAFHDATTAEEADATMRDLGLRWIWPWEHEGAREHEASGLMMHPYKTRVPAARIACFLSHFVLWNAAATSRCATLILEDDCEWIAPLPDPAALCILLQQFGAIGINDPRGATRRAEFYHQRTQAQASPERAVVPAPWVDDVRIPQGLAGASAYLLAPWMAQKLCDWVEVFGCGPNDAILCKQLFPTIGQLTTYCTRVTGRPSSLR